MLSRDGRLEEAYKFTLQLPMDPSGNTWGALLAACRTYKHLKLGRISTNKLFQIEPQKTGNYILLCNLLVNANLWERSSQTRKAMRDKRIVKIPGRSWVQVRNMVYTFVAET